VAQLTTKEGLSADQVELIESCNPDEFLGCFPENKPVFMLCRKIKSRTGALTKNANRPIVDAWARRWEAELLDEWGIESDDVWPMFVSIFDKPMQPSLEDIIVETDSFELPIPWDRYYSDNISRLAKACMLFQRHAGYDPFPLAQSVASKILGKKPSRAHYILAMLVEDKFLELVHQGHKHQTGKKGSTNHYRCPIEIRGY